MIFEQQKSNICNKDEWHQQLISWWPSQYMHLMAELNNNKDSFYLFCQSDHLTS